MISCTAVLFSTLLVGSIFAELVPLNNVDVLPYGVYHIINRWNCDQRDRRCGYELSFTGGYAYLASNDPVPFEIVPEMGTPGVYRIYNKWGCDTGDGRCNAYLSYTNTRVTIEQDDPCTWRIQKIDGTNYWRILNDWPGSYKGYSLSFSGTDAYLIDEYVPWELFIDTDFVARQYLRDVVYDLPALIMFGEQDVTLGTKQIINNGANVVTSDVSLKYEVTTTSSFSNTVGISLSVETSFTVGVPLVASADVTVSMETSYSHTWGEEYSKSKTLTSSDSIQVPAKSTKKVEIKGTQGKLDVPYTATLEIEYKTGESCIHKVEGVYSGSQVYNIVTTVGEAIPL